MSKYDDYWNAIQDWTELIDNPIKKQMDNIFKPLFDNNIVEKSSLDLDDIADPIAYGLTLKEGNITIYIENIHNHHMNKDDEIDFDEEKVNNFNLKKTTFSILAYDIESDIWKIDDWEGLDSLSYKELLLFVKSLLSDDPESDYENSIMLSDKKINFELYKLTNDEEYLTDEAKDIFLF